MLNIVIFGPPGAGKGTHSIRITEKYKMMHISTGDIFREKISKQTPLGMEAKTYMDQGQLVPDELVVKVLVSVVQRNPDVNGFVFDGFPRTINQAEKLDETLKEKNIPLDLVLSLEVEYEELINRLVKRGLDSGRSDDNFEIINQRIEVYEKQTQPLLEYYKKQNKIESVHGIGSIDDIFADICKVIDKHI